MKNLLEADKFNYIIVYKNSHTELNNCLYGARRKRYEQAVRKSTKDKLLSGSYFLYRCLEILGFSKEVCLKAFSAEACHRIALPKGELSYSNSGEYHVLTFSLSDKTGVDIEEYRDRQLYVYKSFLNYDEEFNIDIKLFFYKKWMEREIRFKQSQIKDIEYFGIGDYLCGYAFSSKKKVKAVYLLDLMENDVSEISLLKF